MPSDYERICTDNIRRRGTDFDDIGRFVSDQLYTDRTHFIYELLQNAEDVEATRVAFRLFPGHLEFRHYGGRPFDTRDVEGVSDILKGTKRDDPTKIGKFGIGFKSVFAFTTTPEIHSGDEHFCIERYIRPRAVRAVHLDPGETYMRFPFDHASLSAADAHAQIAKRLANLGVRTLLFLRHIELLDYEVEYEAANGTVGMYARTGDKTSSPHRVTLRGGTAAAVGDETEEHWLLFKKGVFHEDGTAARPIQVAYRIDHNGHSDRSRISPTPDAPVAVSFPTDQRTDLGFLIEGPYVTTSARDNIRRDESWNRALVGETAELVVDSLRWLRDEGLLSVGALEAMPLKSPESHEAYNQQFFRPIHERVRQAFLDEALLPAGDSRFIPAREACLARGTAIRELLSPAQVQLLLGTNHPLSWLSSEITEDRLPALREYLRTALGVMEITPEFFATRFDEQFVRAQDDAWLIKLYGFLSAQRALWRPWWWHGAPRGPMRSKPFIRLRDNRHTAPFDDNDAPLAFLPASDFHAFPVVKESVTRDTRALNFLRDLGLTEPDIADAVIQFILPKYPTAENQSGPARSCSAPIDENLTDIRYVISALAAATGSKKTRLEQQVRRTRFIAARNLVNDELRYATPGDIYIPEGDLYAYFEGNPRAWFVAHTLTAKEAESLCGLGASRQVRIRRREQPAARSVAFQDGPWQHKLPREYYVTIEDKPGIHRRGINGFDPDCAIDGLYHALHSITPIKAAYIWNELLVPNHDQIRGIVESSTRKDYSGSTRKVQLSVVGELVTTVDWVPSPDGHWLRPSRLAFDDLPKSFERDEKLIKALGFRPPVKPEVLETLGLDEEQARFIRENQNLVQQWIEAQRRAQSSEARENHEDSDTIPQLDYGALLTETFQRPNVGEEEPSLPRKGAVRDPDRYRKRLAEDLRHAKTAEPVTETRFRRVPRKIWEEKDVEARAFLVHYHATFSGMVRWAS